MSKYGELFNQLHKKQENFTLSPSLLSFLKNEVQPFLINHDLVLENCLEIGCGTQSLLEVWPILSKNLTKTAIDCSKVAIKKAKSHFPNTDVNYLEADIVASELLTFPSGALSALVPQDIIIDGHALHFIKDKSDRANAFKNIYNLLRAEGLFVAECTIRTNSFQASDSFYLPYAHELEDEILKAGFEIKIFIVKPGLHLESYEDGVVERFEVVTFIARKK